MRREKRPPLIMEQMEVVDTGSDGMAVAKKDGMVVFVPFVVPGDVIDVRVVSRKKRYSEGRAVKFHQRSALRVEPVCEHFGTCGGCRWQNMDYADQLRFKQKQVTDAMQRIGGLEIREFLPILPSERQFHYRNKLEYTFSPLRWLTDGDARNETKRTDMNALGFHIPGMFDRILDIRQCHLQDEPTNEIRLKTKLFALENSFSFYNIRRFDGELRNLVVRDTTTGHLMVIMVFGTDDMERIAIMMNFLEKEFPQITSLYYMINQKKNDSLSDLTPVLWKGEAKMTETMGGLDFYIGPQSFFQTNTRQGVALYETVKSFAGLQPHETVYDLYTGCGTIAAYVAAQCKKVVGIEYVEAAVVDARENARLNGLTNLTFVAGDMAHVLTDDFLELHGVPDVVITDPPRAGMSEKVVRQLLQARPGRIVYVSCNPATQARDLSLLATAYDIVRMQPVDMFPQTHHVENVALLVLKGPL